MTSRRSFWFCTALLAIFWRRSFGHFGRFGRLLGPLSSLPFHLGRRQRTLLLFFLHSNLTAAFILKPPCLAFRLLPVKHVVRHPMAEHICHPLA